MILTKFLVHLFNKSPCFLCVALILLLLHNIKKHILCTLNRRSPSSAFKHLPPSDTDYNVSLPFIYYLSPCSAQSHLVL